MLEVFAGQGQFAASKGGPGQLHVRGDAEHGVVLLLGQMQQLLAQRAGLLELRAHHTPGNQAPQCQAQMRCVSELLTQFPGPEVDAFDGWRSPALRRHQDGAERQGQPEFMLRAVARFWESRDQLQPVGEMRACLRVRGAAHGILGRLQAVHHGPLGVVPLRKVHGEFGCQRRGLVAITAFQASTNLLVQADPPSCGYPLIHDLVIQGVPEPITRGHRPIRPRLGAGREEELLLTGPDGATGLDIRRGQGHPGRDGCNGESGPDHARRFEDGLVVACEVIDMLMDQVLQGWGHHAAQGADLPRDVPTLLPLDELVQAHQLVDDGSEEQGIAGGALVQEGCQVTGERFGVQTLVQIGDDGGFRQVIEHDFRPVCVRAELRQQLA